MKRMMPTLSSAEGSAVLNIVWISLIILLGRMVLLIQNRRCQVSLMMPKSRLGMAIC